MRLKKLLAGILIGVASAAAPITSLATLTDLDTRTVCSLGDGGTVNYTIGFDFQDNDEVRVFLEDQSSTPYTRSELVYGAGAGKFTITGGDPGTTVVMGTAPTSSERCIIQRGTDLTQTVDYTETEAFPANDHEEQMDRMVQMLQEVDYEASTKIGLDEGSTSTTPTFPDPEASTVITYNATPALEARTHAEFISDLDLLVGANNLSDVASASTSRTNLGLGTAATLNAADAQWNANKIQGEDVDATTPTTYHALIYNGNWGPGFITNNNVDSAAAIARSKIAAGTADFVVINDGSGNLSEEAQLDETRGGTGFGSYSTGDILYASASTTLSKLNAGSEGAALVVSSGVPAWSALPADYGFVTIDAPSGTDPVADTVSDTLTLTASDGTIVVTGDSSTDTIDFAVGTGIAVSALAAQTASRAAVYDGSGFLTAATATAAEVDYLSGVTSAIQTQIDGKEPTDADLTALAGVSSNGLLARTGAGTASARTLTGTSNEIDVADGDGVSGNPTVGLADNAVLPGTEGVLLPSGTTAQRDGSATAGEIRYNSDNAEFEGYNGAWGPLGGGSGSGVNFIDNPDFNANADGVSAYADAAGTEPVDGTGAGATVTCTRTTSSPLVDDGSLLITKDANNRQGEGCSIDFVVDAGYRTQTMTISFLMETSANYASEDMHVDIYDVDGSERIEPIGVHEMNLSSQSRLVTAHFYPMDITSDDYRLIFHVASTNSAAYTVKIDEISVSPYKEIRGPPVGDWESFTPSWKGASSDPAIGNGSIVGRKRRVGDSMEVTITVDIGSTTTFGSGVWYFEVPDSLTLDTSKIAYDTGGFTPILGSAAGADAGSSFRNDHVVYYDTIPGISVSDGTTGNLWSSTIPHTWANGDEFSVKFTIPISGWSSDWVGAESYSFDIAQRCGSGFTRVTDTPDALCEYRSYSKTTSSSNTFADAAPSTAPTAADGFVLHPTDYGTAQTSGEISKYEIFIGKYLKGWKLKLAATTGLDGRVIYGNSLLQESSSKLHGVDVDYDAVLGVVYVDAGTSPTASLTTRTCGLDSGLSDLTTCYFDISVSKEAVVAGVESLVRVSAENTASQSSVSDSTPTDVIFEDQLEDTHGAYDNTTGIFTAPRSGTYAVCAMVSSVSSGAWAAAETFILRIMKNTSTIRSQAIWFAESGTTMQGVVMHPCMDVVLVAGDTVNIDVYQTSGGALELSNTNYESFLKITEVR